MKIKRIKKSIYVYGKNNDRFRVRINDKYCPLNKTYNSLEEAEQALLEHRKTLKSKNYDYPLDFIEALTYNYENIDIKYIEENFDVNIKFALSTLTEREQIILTKRFIEFYSLEAVGLQENITRERVRQIEAKALRKLRHPARLVYITKGFEIRELQEDIYKLKEELYLIKEKLIYEINNPDTIELNDEDLKIKTKIEELNLSCRAYNCLKRANINTIGDLKNKSEDDMTKIRNLGKKSIKEIECKLKEYYIRNYNI